jgi:hypothetical protein
MNKLVIILAATSLVGCAPTASSLFPLKQDEAVSLVKSNITMDGKPDGQFSTNCFLGFTSPDNKNLTSVKDRETGYYLVKSQGGLVQVSGISCLGYKVFYNKLRTYEFKDLGFEAQAGAINDAGTLSIDWETSAFNFGDMIGAGGFQMGGANQGVIQLKQTAGEDLAVKNYLAQQKLPTTGLTIKPVRWNSHKLLTQ